ncbi:hypothetical protein ACFZAM_31420 [Streptomyces sp. NPDC008079]|uniref:hypothetical protein n=1 Tax=Streptomyces sp. NPDC008079 TaxID=3364806 RepID=UPI0036E60500
MDLSPKSYGRTVADAVPPAPLQQHTPTASPPSPPCAVTDLLDEPQDWTWEQLRDYVVRAAVDRHGPQPADPIKTASIFKSFHDRWGRQAGPIARFAFEAQDGYWRSAPVTPNRFCRASDEYFAKPIAERLVSAP